jgi:RecB family exonuclease
MTASNLSRLTATRLSTLRRCPRQHYYRYELALSRVRTTEALRFGAAFHAGLEVRSRGQKEDRKSVV